MTAQASAATGIPVGTPVFAGGADTESALLGTGVHRPGETCAVLGTTTPVQQVVARPVIDAGGNLWTSCHVVPGRWVLESNAGDTGNAYRWLLGLLFGRVDAAVHAEAEALLANVRPDGHSVLSFIGPVRFNLQTMNPFQPAGVLFRVPLLHIDRPGRAELLRGFVENTAFAIRANIEQIEAVSGERAPTLYVSGGLTQSPTLLRAIASLLGRPLTVGQVIESASLGSAMLAAVGAGIHADLPAALASMVRTRSVEPDGGEGAVLEERYRKWLEIFDAFHGWTI